MSRGRLTSLQILSPCQERWAQMPGDDQRRYCAKCEHSVTDLSSMTTPEAEATLAAGPLCVRVTRDEHGAIVTRTTQYQSLLSVLQRFANKKA